MIVGGDDNGVNVGDEVGMGDAFVLKGGAAPRQCPSQSTTRCLEAAWLRSHPLRSTAAVQ